MSAGRQKLALLWHSRERKRKVKTKGAYHLPYLLFFLAICVQVGFMLRVNVGSKLRLSSDRLNHTEAKALRARERHSRNERERHLSKGKEAIPKPNLAAVPDQKLQQLRGDSSHIGEGTGPGKKTADNNIPWPKPQNWESYSFHRIRDHFKCKVWAHDQHKPLPSPEHWELFRSTYKNVVDQTAAFDDPVPPGMGYTLIDGPQPYFAKHSNKGGRGLFASRDIKKGELVHDGNKSDILFTDGMSWRRYIFSLPRDRACDMIDWTWTQKTKHNGKFHIFAAINISILMNSAGLPRGVNVEPESPLSSKFYAKKDIKKGQELLMDYDIYPTLWHKVGL